MDQFLRLRCAGDVLESIQPATGDIECKINEAMALIATIRPFVLREPNKWKVLDISAGPPITGVIAAHLLPVESVKALVWRHGEKLSAINRVSHLKVETCYEPRNPVGSDGWERVWKDTTHGHTLVVAARPNYEIACGVAINTHERALPMAMLPARVHAAFSGGDHLRLTERNLRWYGESGDKHLLYLGRLANLADGDFKFLPYALFGANDGIVTRGL
jgi:hypothetical protein